MSNAWRAIQDGYVQGIFNTATLHRPTSNTNSSPETHGVCLASLGIFKAWWKRSMNKTRAEKRGRRTAQMASYLREASAREDAGLGWQRTFLATSVTNGLSTQQEHGEVQTLSLRANRQRSLVKEPRKQSLENKASKQPYYHG